MQQQEGLDWRTVSQQKSNIDKNKRKNKRNKKQNKKRDLVEWCIIYHMG